MVTDGKIKNNGNNLKVARRDSFFELCKEGLNEWGWQVGVKKII